MDFRIYAPQTDVIDPLGSVIINTNTTTAPNYTWLTTHTIKAIGPVGAALVDERLPYRNTVSYKIKFLDTIPQYNNNAQFIGDSLCLTSPNTCSGRGPFYIGPQKYYIDYFFLYFVNTSGSLLYSPLFSVDDDKCDEEYGIFVGAPKVPAGTNVTLNSTNPALSLLAKNTVAYTNDLSGIVGPASSVIYKFTTATAVTSGSTTTYTPTEAALSSYSAVVNLVQQTINNGQVSIVSEDNNGLPIQLNPNGPGAANSYYPFIVFRYVSENASTRQINVNFTFSATVS